MSRPKSKPASATAPAEGLLHAVPCANRAMEVTRLDGGGMVAAVPMRRPRYLVPPLSWILPYSSHRRVELDALGAGVLDLCDGSRNVERVIEEFAARHKLSFREAQLAVTQFLKQLTQRGLLAIVGHEDLAGNSADERGSRTDTGMEHE